MAELCLGTVQFGMKYGINNLYGQPDEEDAIKMIDYAIKYGVKTIDTASAYGTAELVLGKYIRRYGLPDDVKIITKLRPNIIEKNQKDITGIVKRELENSFERIGVNSLDGYLLHTPEYVYSYEIMDALQGLKEEHLVNNIGVSIYDIKEGEYAINTGVVDYIQLPYSILDQRGMRSGFIARAKKAGVKVYTRSAFLQGLILMEEKKIPDKLISVKPELQTFAQIVKKYDEDIIKTLIHFITENNEIDYLVFGVDNIEQLRENIEKYKEEDLPSGLIEELQQKLMNLDKNIIFPSLWSNGKRAE